MAAGEAEFTLRELVTARGNRLQLPLQDGALDASCTLIAQDCSALNSEVRRVTDASHEELSLSGRLSTHSHEMCSTGRSSALHGAFFKLLQAVYKQCILQLSSGADQCALAD